MNFSYDQLELMVQTHLKLVEVDQNAIRESRERAAKFLVLQSILADHMKILEDIKVKASTIEKATRAQVLLKYAGKKATEFKILAEGDPEYAATRESLELIDSEFNWTKRHFEIFGNAHVMFRQYSNLGV